VMVPVIDILLNFCLPSKKYIYGKFIWPQGKRS
jgi:hypothetical protein